MFDSIKTAYRTVRDGIKRFISEDLPGFLSVLILGTVVFGAFVLEILEIANILEEVSAKILVFLIGVLCIHLVWERATSTRNAEERIKAMKTFIAANEKAIGDLISAESPQNIANRVTRIENKLETKFSALNRKIQQIDKRFAFLSDSRIDELKENTRQALAVSLKRYVQIQRLKSTAKPINYEFGTIANVYLREQEEELRLLSRGEIRVANKDAAEIYKLLAKEYKKRFDAVSHNDLVFWNSAREEDREYFRTCQNQALEKTPVTRVFIFSNRNSGNVRSVFDRTPREFFKDSSGKIWSSFDTLVHVLEKHEKTGISWAIAIEDEFDDELQQLIAETENIPDFALFDGGKAVSYFRQIKGPREFSIIFDTGEKKNTDEIERIKKIYAGIISNCWLANSEFASRFEDSIENDDYKVQVKLHLARRARAIKTKLSKISGVDITEINEDTFPLIAGSEAEIESKTAALDSLLGKYQHAIGRP